MANQRDPRKRQRCFGVPVGVCVRFERIVGVQEGCEPDRIQRELVTVEMNKALEKYELAHCPELSEGDRAAVATEVESNRARNRRKYVQPA